MYLFNSDLLRRNSTLNVFTSVSLAVLLAGCGSESNSDGEQGVIVSPTASASISAQDIQDNSLVEQSFTIDLTEHVHTSNNQDFFVTNARSLSGDSCQVQGISEGSFNVYSSDVNDCLFEYEVATSARTSMATSYVRVAMGQNYSSTTLPRITASTIESQVVVVDLESELGSSLPSDDFVLQDSLISLGSGTAHVSGEHQIEFTPTAKGQTEVYYSYQNGESIQQGSLSIATSEDTYNTAPTAEDFAFSELALLGENIVVDVADYISDVDLDDVQLVGVQDFNSTTLLYDPANISNTKFEFSSTQPGAHDVAYTVSDHMGGYTTGLARIEVEPDFSLIQDWEDIVTHDPVISSDIRFFAPMTKVYADYVNVSYTGTYVENGTQGLQDAEIVTQTLSQARQYCKVRGGRLPLQRELETLVTNETSAFTNHNWPTSKKYWIAENVSETNAATVHLNDGSIGNQSKTVGMYTTCVDLSNPSVSDFSVTAEYIDGTGNQYHYKVQVFDPDGVLASYADMVLSSQDNMGVFDNNEPTKDVIADSIGEINEIFFDTSFNDSVLVLSTSSVDDFYPFIPKPENSELEVTNTLAWNSVQWRETPIPNDYSNGLPVLFENDSHVSHVYKSEFVGENFILAAQINTISMIDAGSVSFTFQQLGNDASLWPSSALPEGGTAQDNSGAGYARDETTFGIVISYYSSTYQLVHEGAIDSQDIITDSTIRNLSNYVWFDKRGQQVDIYSATEPQRPHNPIGSFDIPDSIDLTKPYWLVVGGSNWYQSQADVMSLHVSAY
ncbi:repeat uncharacterized protein DUF823 [Vibrio crassostreae]|uniref:hypothetical protein n=1 Tax=Vibrio crassostreae TaxID=246167 RepID=UPI00104FCF8A|nr:hypothetical protein [Vibrio crassostreae]TCT43602.1 repeat uncharacterized protein DUF823 [Vibrio crassostreae]TCV63372.1 repeat uncharacterized protein DUF823 [Vibrio crassostreae]